MKESKPLVIKIQGNKKYQRLLGGAPQTAGLRSGYVNLKPGQDVGEHSTGAKEEVIIILEGKAKITSDKHRGVIAGLNTLCYVPVYTNHNVKNLGEKMLRYIYIVSPVKNDT